MGVAGWGGVRREGPRRRMNTQILLQFFCASLLQTLVGPRFNFWLHFPFLGSFFVFSRPPTGDSSCTQPSKRAVVAHTQYDAIRAHSARLTQLKNPGAKTASHSVLLLRLCKQKVSK